MDSNFSILALEVVRSDQIIDSTPPAPMETDL